jgi:hypothetical protein
MRLALCLALVLASGCAHEVIDLGTPPPPLPGGGARLELTVTVVPGSFEASRLSPEGLTQHFADQLRTAGLFAGVIQPAPAGLEPLWEIQLSARDGGSEPDANFWKSLVGNALPPLLFFVHLENDYQLDLTALLLRQREIVGTYTAHAAIRHRYQAYADHVAMENEALASLARRTAQQIVVEIASDRERLRAEDQRLASR